MNSDTTLYRKYASRMNIVRFLAICSIVWGHCLYEWDDKVFKAIDDQIIQVVMLQIGRVGTIMFFLISGFFISDKIESFNIAGYLKYRWFSLIIPWFVFLLLYVLIETFHIVSSSTFLHGHIKPAIQTGLTLFRAFIFHGSYWFVPASVIIVLVLITFKKYLNQTWFGGLLAFVTLFCAVNLYYHWIFVDHIKTFLGYTFFLWAGIQLKRHIKKVDLFIEKISWWLLCCIIVAGFALACIESLKLISIGCEDTHSSLRFSNSILSVACFLALLKSTSWNWINKLHSQRYVYGIYLVHSIVDTETSPFLNRYIAQHNLFRNLPYLAFIQVLFFIAILSASYLLVVAVSKSPLYFILGRRSQQTRLDTQVATG